jgi:hypothetical protein
MGLRRSHTGVLSLLDMRRNNLFQLTQTRSHVAQLFVDCDGKLALYLLPNKSLDLEVQANVVYRTRHGEEQLTA